MAGDKVQHIRNRKSLEDYAVSIIKPLLDGNSPVWDKNKPIIGKAHWAGHFYTYLEMYARPLWTLPFILKYRKKTVYIEYSGKKEKIEDWYKEGILAGTSPESSSYWGDYKVYGQMSTEIAPVALALYFGKEFFWDQFSRKEQKQISDWLYKISAVYPVKTHRNNHFWFPVLINLVLKRLGLKYHRNIINESLKKLDEFYIDNGWFYDGTIGRYDYYIPWSHHLYPMIWIILEDENEKDYKIRKEKYIERTNKFLQYYPYFFDKTGLYVPWGRSLSYRFAAVGLFALAVYNGCDIEPGLARRITLKNIEYFKNNGAEAGKKVLPGFSYVSYQNVERYMSVSSSYWLSKGFFSLIMDEKHKFWRSKEILFPAEKENFKYDILMKNVNLKIVGEPEINGVSLYNNSCYVKVGGFGSTNEFYGKFVYNSRSGFGTSTRDWVASDNMISLMTKDKLLTSHRAMFKDLGEKNGVFYSEHVPFSNDKFSKIKTALLPLDFGFHLRAHKVKLAKKYVILEGGFSVGKKIDEETVFKGNNWMSVAADGGTSLIYSYLSDEINFQVRKIHPDAHILYPLAIYPAYVSAAELDKGEYLFISVFYYTSRKITVKKSVRTILKQIPVIKFNNRNNILVEFNKRKYRIQL